MISLAGITKVFYTDDLETHALDGIHLDVGRGEFLSIAGPSGYERNAANLLMNPANGLRADNDVDQLAGFEFAATFTSQGVRNLLQNIEPGMTELQAARLIGMNCLPQSALPMLSAGARACSRSAPTPHAAMPASRKAVSVSASATVPKSSA